MCYCDRKGNNRSERLKIVATEDIKRSKETKFARKKEKSPGWTELIRNGQRPE
jgi:hypothetical protein